MLETCFSAPKTLRRLRSGPSGPYIVGFADALEKAGYSKASGIRYLRNAAHLGQFLQRNGDDLAALDARSLQAFRRHLLVPKTPRRSRANAEAILSRRRRTNRGFGYGYAALDCPRRAKVRTQAGHSMRHQHRSKTDHSDAGFLALSQLPRRMSSPSRSSCSSIGALALGNTATMLRSRGSGPHHQRL